MNAGTRRRALRTFGLAGGVASLALAGCGAESAATTPGAGNGAMPGAAGTAAGGQKTPVTIGAVVSTTGSNGKAGQYQSEAYTLWEEQVNTRGGLLGRPVRLTILDDASDPTDGAKLYEKLISEDKVDLVLGPYASSATMAASTIAERNKVPMLAAGSSASDIWKRNYQWIFGVYAVAESLFDGVVDLAVKQGYKTMAILYENTVFPVATANGTAAYAKSKGLQVVFQDRYPTATTNVSTLLNRVKELNPDVLVGGSYEPDSLLITRQAKSLDVNPRLLAFSVGAASTEFGSALGPDADFVIGSSTWEPTLATPGNKEFVASYQKRWNRDPAMPAATGFAGGQILEAAVKKASSLDRAALRDTLAALETTTILPGSYKVDQNGQQSGHIPVLIQWQGKEKPIVWPDQLKTGTVKLPVPAWKSR
jgi:branched-chain amino acid transport system substrate-binding protein